MLKGRFGKQYFKSGLREGQFLFYSVKVWQFFPLLLSVTSGVYAVVSPNSGRSMAFATGGWGRIDGCDVKALTLLGIQQNISQAVNSPQTAIITSS